MIKLPITRKIDIEQLLHSLNLTDDWFLCAFPIDKDGNISMLFTNIDNDDDFLCPEGHPKEHRYIVAQQTWNGHYTTTFSFKFQDLTLVKFELLPNGYYFVTRDANNENFVEVYDANTHEHFRFSIGFDVYRIAVTSNGTFAVGYYETKHTPAVIIFSADGRIIWSYGSELAKGCLDLTVDTDDNICFLSRPENKLYRVLSKNYDWIEAFDMPVSNCSGFTAETDTSYLDCPPHCLLDDDASHWIYWYNGKLYPCEIEGYSFSSLGLSSFLADKYAVLLDNQYLALGSSKDIDITNTIISEIIEPSEVIGFPKGNDVLQYLHASNKLGLTYRHENSPRICYVDYGKEIELVYSYNDADSELSMWEYHFNSEHYNKLRAARCGNDYSFYAAIWSTDIVEKNSQAPFRITTLVPKGRLYGVSSYPRKYIESGQIYDVQIACYQASKIRFYDGQPETLLPPESFISYEALNKGPEPYAAITGQIKEIKKKFNPYTGIPFIHLTVKCIYLILDVLVENTEEIELLKPNSYIQGTFRLSAKIK